MSAGAPTSTGVKRLVDLVDRGPQDDYFFPSTTKDTIFHRKWTPQQNAVPDIIELSYRGNAAWGNRIVIPIPRVGSGDLIQWICLRIQPSTWVPGDVEARLKDGTWDYQNKERAWMWAASLGTIAIQKIELMIGDTLIETWAGEWMDIWSRLWLDGGRSTVWDTDIYSQIAPHVIRDTGRPAWTTLQPTQDGYVYCYLPLAFLKRSATAFPIVALGGQDMRIHITLRPFHEVVRRRTVAKVSPVEVPLGESTVFIDNTGATPIPYIYNMLTQVPAFRDATVLAGVVHLDEPLRAKVMREPQEIMYEPITYLKYDIADKLANVAPGTPVDMQIFLRELNGPVRELCWMIRRKDVWQFNEWTNYGRLSEQELIETYGGNQAPLMSTARLYVGNAIWYEEPERWWRTEYAVAHRGGVRAANGMLYGFVFGGGAGWEAEDFQPAATVNTSRTTLRLDLTILAPNPTVSACAGLQAYGWEVHVFATGINWLRCVNGLMAPLFRD